jgi:hypothetical protein
MFLYFLAGKPTGTRSYYRIFYALSYFYQCANYYFGACSRGILVELVTALLAGDLPSFILCYFF